MRICEDIKTFDFKLYSLYVNTSGYAYIEYWPSRKRKYFFPNEKGYIYVFRRKINLKRLIYGTYYPNLDISNKIVVKLKGNHFSIMNLYALTKNQYQNFLKYRKTICKNIKTGECFFKQKVSPMGE